MHATSAVSTPPPSRPRRHLNPAAISTPPPRPRRHLENQRPVNGQQSSDSVDLAASLSCNDWIADWEQNYWEWNNPGRPRPPSAKSVYCLADTGAAAREGVRIVWSLTMDNVVQEALSAFSAAFTDVCKVEEVNYMFEHWLDVRKGPLLNKQPLARDGVSEDEGRKHNVWRI
ncbi:hypothetical protein LXA43DRAFT_1094905 [Ganoderma leucocontextum]|nr:hypothetical protein LXA43DRAFT_1094905 [Ganoderma leucocontextum]